MALRSCFASVGATLACLASVHAGFTSAPFLVTNPLDGGSIHFPRGCEASELFIGSTCTIGGTVPAEYAMNADDVLVFRVLPSADASETKTLVSIVPTGKQGQVIDVDIFAVPVELFEARMTSTVRQNRAIESRHAVVANLSSTLRSSLLSHPSVLDIDTIAAAVVADSDGWPAYALRKASVLEVHRGVLGDVQGLLSCSDRTKCGRGWVVVAKAGAGGARVQAAATDAGAVEHGRALQAPSYQPLALNTPLTGTVGWQTWKYYSFDAPKPLTGPLSITITPGVGDADLFVTVDGQAPTKDNWQYQSSGFLVLEKVTLQPNDSGATGKYCSSSSPGVTCPIRIGVYGYTAAYFTITITAGTGPAVPLASGVPIVDDVAAGSVNYYSLTSQATAPGGSFAFTVTKLTGDPDLYISSSTKGSITPNNSASCVSAWSSSGVETITLSPGDPGGCYCGGPGCTYYIGVQAKPIAGPAAYVLVGLEEGSGSELVDGIPASGIVPAGMTDQYTLTVQPLPPGVMGKFKRMVELALLPLGGNPDLYVTLDGRTPGPTSWDYRSFSASGVDYVAMRDTDRAVVASPCKNWTATCSVRVGVYGQTQSAYLIASDTGYRPLALTDGGPIEAYLDAGYYAFFSFTVSDPTLALVITVEPLAGYTATYVGAQYNNATLYPNAADTSSYIWKSTTLTANVVVIEPTDALSCKLSPCTYFIGVRSVTNNATFTVLARTRGTAVTSLQPGLPLLDVVDLQDYSRYRATFDRRLGYLEVTVSPLFGDPDLYIALDGRTVNRTSFQYAAAEMGQDDDIVIYPTDSAFRSSCGNGTGDCTASIAVYGYTGSTYFITASSGLRILADGDTTTGKVMSPRYTYFAIDVWRATPVTIAVTPVSGDPDLVVSVSNPTPTYENNTWAATGDSVDIVVVDPNDPRAVPCFANPPCRIFIGVQGWGTGMNIFRISASSSSTTTLLEGVPTVGEVAPGTMAYFLFNAPSSAAQQGLMFTAEALDAGMDVTLFISNIDSPVSGLPAYPTIQCLEPTCEDFTVSNSVWDSGEDADRGEVRISAGDPRLTSGLYVVGVYSAKGGDVIVQGGLWGDIMSLTPGLPYEDSVPQGVYAYYSLSITRPGVDVTIAVTPLAGDPDLFLSFLDQSNRFPVRGKADRQASGYTTEVITVTWAENLACQAIFSTPDCASGSSGNCACYIFASVYGYDNATYTITGTINNNGTAAVRLLDGLPQSGMVSVDKWAYYYADVNLPYGQSYSFSLSVSGGGDADLYVTTDGLGPPSIYPSHFQYSSAHFDGDELVDVQPGSSAYNSTVKAWAGVHGYSGNASYTITFMTTLGVTQLSEGRQQTGAIGVGQYAYYSYSWSSPAGSTLTFSVTNLAGDPDLYAGIWPTGTPRFRPTTTIYTWKGTAAGADSITIAGTDPKACRSACTLILAVYCASSSNCRYGLTVTNTGSGPGSMVQLVNGQPQAGSVAAGSYTYFSFNPGSSTTALSFRVTATSGDAQLVVTNGYVPGTSTPSTLPVNQAGQYVWSSARGYGTGATGTGVVNIPTTDPKRVPSSLLYVIGVYGVSGTGPTPTPSPGGGPPQVAFTITASSSDTPVLLQNGVPSTRNYVAMGSTAHFSVDLPDTTQDLTVVAVVGDGAVTIAISPTNPLPTCTGGASCGDAVWTSVVNGAVSSVVRISAPQPGASSFLPCSGPYVAGTCTQASWRAGKYYIGVYGVSNTDFTITAFTSSAYSTLVEGQPQTGTLSLMPSALPAVFAYRTGQDQKLPDVRFSFDAATVPLSWYLRSCVDTECTAADQLPGPTNNEFSGSVPAQTSIDVFVTKYMPGTYCAAGLGRQCVYFVAVYIAGGASGCTTDPTGVTCPPVTFSLSAATLSGRYANVIQQSSINNKVYSMTGNVAPGGSALYELYLDPTTKRDVTVDLQACTNGWPSLYICNPSPPTGSGVSPCDDPFSPSSGMNTGAGSTAPNGANTPGAVRWVERNVQTSNYFLSVAADTTAAGPAFGAGNWMYQLSISSGTAYYLSAGVPGQAAPAVGVSALDPVTFNITWPGVSVVDDEGAYSRPAKGVTYYVYPALGGFIPPGNPTGTIATTACGIFLWAGSQPEDVEPVATLRDVTWAVVSGLSSGSGYEFAVIAECDKTCWGQTFPTGGQEEEGVGQAPGYTTQRVVYPIVGASTGVPGGGNGGSTRIPPAGVAGIVVTLVVVMGAGVAFMWYRRSHALDRTYQYSALDLNAGAGVESGGISHVPDWGTSGSGGRVANPLVRSGPGLLTRMRQSFAPTQATGSYNKQGLADSDYSTLEDRVEAYM